MSYADSPLLVSKEVGRGRVLQMLSDEFWNVAFKGDSGANDIYGAFLKQALLYLQHHPDADSKELKLAEMVHVGSKMILELPAGQKSPLLTWLVV